MLPDKIKKISIISENSALKQKALFNIRAPVTLVNNARNFSARVEGTSMMSSGKGIISITCGLSSGPIIKAGIKYTNVNPRKNIMMINISVIKNPQSIIDDILREDYFHWNTLQEV